MWSQDRYQHMSEFIKEVCKFGFTHIELNYTCTSSMVNEFLKIEDCRISSVHAPCPAARLRTENEERTPRLLSSLDEDIRREGIDGVKRSIKLAAKVGACAVVIHCGRVDMGFDLTDRLNQMYEEGLFGTSQYAALQEQIMAKRASLSTPHIEAALKSLKTIEGFAAANGVKLGLENRVSYYEIPTFDEMHLLLSELPPDVVGYWHDVGHAEIQSRLGFAPHGDWFEAYGDRMIGVHLHDVTGIKDHLAPGIGEMDWDMIARNLPSPLIKTCEIGPWNDPQDVANTVGFLKKKNILTG